MGKIPDSTKFYPMKLVKKKKKKKTIPPPLEGEKQLKTVVDEVLKCHFDENELLMVLK